MADKVAEAAAMLSITIAGDLLGQQLRQSYRDNYGDIYAPNHHLKTIKPFRTRFKASFNSLVAHGTFPLMRFNLSDCLLSSAMKRSRIAPIWLIASPDTMPFFAAASIRFNTLAKS
jgi:hypothetical protein